MADTVFSFGMHTGKTFQQIFDSDKWYVQWAIKQDDAGSIKCKNGLLKRFADFCRAAGGGKEGGCEVGASSCSAAASLPSTPWSQQATQAEYIMMPNPMLASNPKMAQQPMMVATPMASHHHMMPHAMAPYERKEVEYVDPTWARVLEHLDERGIDFETVRDAHHDTRRDILKAVFFGDPILRAQAETQWLRLRQEKAGQQRARSRSRGRKMNWRPCSISTSVAPSFSAGF